MLKHFLQIDKFENMNLAARQKFMAVLVKKRNIRIANKIHQTLTEMPNKSHFMVAGVSHYIGNHNVPNLLRKQGYTVTAK